MPFWSPASQHRCSAFWGRGRKKAALLPPFAEKKRLLTAFICHWRVTDAATRVLWSSDIMPALDISPQIGTCLELVRFNCPKICDHFRPVIFVNAARCVRSRLRRVLRSSLRAPCGMGRAADVLGRSLSSWLFVRLKPLFGMRWSSISCYFVKLCENVLCCTRCESFDNMESQNQFLAAFFSPGPASSQRVSAHRCG